MKGPSKVEPARASSATFLRICRVFFFFPPLFVLKPYLQGPRNLPCMVELSPATNAIFPHYQNCAGYSLSRPAWVLLTDSLEPGCGRLGPAPLPALLIKGFL